MGRPPTELPEADEQLAIDLASEGRPRREILERLGISSSLFSAYRTRNNAFSERFARAEHDGLELMADDLKTMHDSHKDVQRGRLASDNAKFLLSKRIPHVYGDRIDLNVTERVDVHGALLEAHKRIPRPERDLESQGYPQVAEYSEVYESGTHGSEPSDHADNEGDPPGDLDDLLS